MAMTTGSWSDVVCTVPALMRSIGDGRNSKPLPVDTVEDYPIPADATYVILRCIIGSYFAYKFKSATDLADPQYYDGGPFLDFCALGSTNIEKIPKGATAVSIITGAESHVTMSFR
ncbi:MAG: hypothetical protein WCI81_04070 [Chlorobiaceae bacterium]